MTCIQEEIRLFEGQGVGLCRRPLFEHLVTDTPHEDGRMITVAEDEIRQALRVSVHEDSIVPVLMGSNTMARGMFTLMVDIIKYFPSPDNCKVAGINTLNNEVFDANYDFSKSKSAYVFKTIVDPYIGKYSLI